MTLLLINDQGILRVQHADDGVQAVRWSRVSDPTSWVLDGEEVSAIDEESAVKLTQEQEAKMLTVYPQWMLADQIVERDRRLAAQAEQIGELMCERDQLRREIAAVRELLSRVDVPVAQPVALHPAAPSAFPANALKHAPNAGITKGIPRP